ncbi:MAG: taurine dioxygenase [Gammaproteobacteria bacterium]|jgi:taurine dioxygenase
MSIETRDLAGGVGREVLGINLSDELGDDVKDAIRDALSSHCALLFRGQSLQPQEQIRFTEIFGEPQPHPLKTRRTVDGFPQVLILENRPGKRGAPNDYWHSDISHSKTPPSLSILHSLKVPEGRGDTMICNMYAAWESLSDGMRDMLSKMRAEHSGEATVQRSQITGQDALPLSDIPAPSMHPVGRTHPQTGRVALFVNPEHFTTRFEDMTKEESQPLMDFLNRHATKPENIYRHRWAVGDVLMWDNRCTMHYAVRDYEENMPRLMHRTTVGGEVPA